MKKKLRTVIILFTITTFLIENINGQVAHRFNLNIAAGISTTGSMHYGEQYRRSDITPTFNILTTGTSRNRNYNFSIGYQPNESISINGSIGIASFGFQYSADMIASPLNTISVGGFVANENYTTRLMEVGLSATYRVAYNSDLAFVIQPGVAWYTNPKGRSEQLLSILIHSNSFSATIFGGIEIPITNNAFFVRVGVNTKIALSNFARSFHFDNKFYPYALGLETSISYRFGAYFP